MVVPVALKRLFPQAGSCVAPEVHERIVAWFGAVVEVGWINHPQLAIVPAFVIVRFV